MSIPIIDCGSATAAKDFSSALHEIGFVVIKNHGIENSRFCDMYRVWQNFFESDNKDECLFDVESKTGFVPQSVAELPRSSDKRDIKEFFDFVPRCSCPDQLKFISTAYYNDLNRIGMQLLGWLQEGLPQDHSNDLEDTFMQLAEDSENTILRVIHYPPLAGNEERGAVRAAEHADTNFITLLPTATKKGLQVRLQSGDWVDVPLVEGSIVVNCGDMLSYATNGFYRSAYHRVLNPDANDNSRRLSMPMFVHPKTGSRLSKDHTRESYFAEVAAKVVW